MKWRLAMNSEQVMWERNRAAGANMLQIGVAVYFVVLWAGIVLGAQMPQSLPHLLALLLVSALIIVPLAPRLARLLLKPLCLAAKRAAAPPRGFHRARRGSHPWRTGNTGSGARPRTGHLPRPPLSDEVPRTFSAIARQAAPAIRRRSGREGIPCPARATSPCASPLPQVDREHLRICPDPRPRHRGPLGRHPPYRPALPARRRGKRRARDRRAHPAGEVCAPSRRDLPGESERDAPTSRPEDGRAEQET